MRRFIAQLNDGRHINVQADRMSREENMYHAYNGGELVAAVDVDAVIFAYLSEKGEK